MACREPLDTEDVESKRAAVSPTAGSPAPKSEPVKVLLWNINGSGPSEPRKLVLKSVVQETDPDVILLQEVMSKVWVEPIIKIGYKEVNAGEEKEAKILYKTNKFSAANTEREVLDTTIDGIVPQGDQMITRSGQVGWRKTFKNRISIVHLTTKGYSIVFLSFHNAYAGLKQDVRQRSSEQFCQIVSQISQTSQCTVIAGADLNYALPFGECKGSTVLEYTATERRPKTKDKKSIIIDHFIVAPQGIIRNPKTTVEALNFVDTKAGERLHKGMASIEPDLKRLQYHKILNTKDDDLHKALDSSLDNGLDQNLRAALQQALVNGVEAGLRNVLDQTQLHTPLSQSLQETLSKALDQALQIDVDKVSNHDPILLTLTIDTKKRV